MKVQTIAKINKIQIWFFVKINKIDELLVKLTKKERQLKVLKSGMK